MTIFIYKQYFIVFLLYKIIKFNIKYNIKNKSINYIPYQLIFTLYLF